MFKRGAVVALPTKEIIVISLIIIFIIILMIVFKNLSGILR
jgi:hypothetical protein